MKRLTNVHKFKLASSLLAAILVGAVGYTLWFVYHTKDVVTASYAASAQSPAAVVSARDRANVVEDTQNGSPDLVAFLRADDTGCWRNGMNDRGWYRVVKEVNGTQADMEYGCLKTHDGGNGAPGHILAHKVADKWQLISPTNQWDWYTAQIPSCAMLKANDILATLEPGCWTTQNAKGTVVVPNQNSQYATNYSTCALALGSRVSKQPVGICVTKDGVFFSQK